jgi:hypothetical protein
MRFKTEFVLFSAVLFVLVGTAMADKSYPVKVTDAAKAGSIQLQPGDYELVLDNSRVLFRELKTGKEFEVDAKIDESAAKKYASTALHSSRVDGAMLITEIELGGTKTKVTFR